MKFNSNTNEVSHNSSWIVCQLGAREHYSIAASLHSDGCLDAMFTDVWVPPNGSYKADSRATLKRLGGAKLVCRYSAELCTASVGSVNGSYLRFELRNRVLRRRGWNSIIARNDWFQQCAVEWLEQRARRTGDREGPPVLFAYSYAALSLFRWAKAQGWLTVLGQIDAGYEDEQIMINLHRENEANTKTYCPAPSSYWNHWRAECRLADRIIVNSNWSRKLIELDGVEPLKLTVLPIAYTAPLDANSVAREYPQRFSVARPLRVLFLGQVSVRKGVLEMLAAAGELIERPVQFSLVGPEVLAIPEKYHQLTNVKFVGPVPRSEVGRWFRDSDVFLFPTHSDGFGLTQLEAQAWKLPVIATRNCGDVIEDDFNGRRLESVTATSIVAAIEQILQQPSTLARWSRNSHVSKDFSQSRLSQQLRQLF